MGFLGDLGAPDLGGGMNIAGAGQTALIIFLAFIVLIIAGIFTFSYYNKKQLKSQYKYRIHIFKDINGKPQPIGDDVAMDVYVKDTNVSLIYLKKNKIYLARPTLSLGRDGHAFWYNILPNAEWVNFDMNTPSGNTTFAEANYDHRDTRYAYINLKEIIKRNYKDKSVKWWKEYANVIGIVITSIVFFAGLIFLLIKFGKVISVLGPISENFKAAADTMTQAATSCQQINSGVVSA